MDIITSSLPGTKISILGTGNMGRALGTRLSQLNHSVFFGGRNPSAAPKRAAELASSQNGNSRSESGTLDAAALFGDVLIWTMRERDVNKILGEDGWANLKGKKAIPVLDLNNWDFANETAAGKGAGLDQPSLGDMLQENFRRADIDAVVVKAFTTVPMELFALDKELLGKEDVQVYLADDEVNHEDAKDVCASLIREIGFQTVDLGSGKMAMRMTEIMGDVMRFWLSRGAGKSVWSHLGVRGLPKGDPSKIGERRITYMRAFKKNDSSALDPEQFECLRSLSILILRQEQFTTSVIKPRNLDTCALNLQLRRNVYSTIP